MRVDLHLHTRESSGPPQYWLAGLLGVHECYSSPEDVLAEAMRKGLDAIAITNHDVVEHSLSMAREHPERVIPGCEYKVYGGVGRYADVIVLGVDEKAHGELLRERHRGVERFAHTVRELGLIAILAHPAWEVSAVKRGIEPKILCQWYECFDLIEGRNSNCPAESKVASAAARYFRKACTGGSDAHDVPSVGMAWTEAEAKTIPEFLECLRAGDVRPGGGSTDPSKFAATSREVLGAFYRRELLKIARGGSLRAVMSVSSLMEMLRMVAQALILPGLLWIPQVKTKAYLAMLERRAGVLRSRLVDHLSVDLARDLAIEDIPTDERRRRFVERTRDLLSAFALDGGAS
jgi:predicted metal-dependent phosphoesterase TrpH